MKPPDVSVACGVLLSMAGGMAAADGQWFGITLPVFAWVMLYIAVKLKQTAAYERDYKEAIKYATAELRKTSAEMFK